MQHCFRFLSYPCHSDHCHPASLLYYRAIGGLDTALQDLRGRLEGLPVCSLLGGTPGPVRACGSSMQREITPVDEAHRLEKLKSEFGFHAFKFRIGSECGHDRDEWPGRTENLDYYPWQDKLFTESPNAIIDGHATVMDQPDWGAEPAAALAGGL